MSICMACRHVAAAEGQLSTVNWLLVAKSCNPNLVDRFSRTPLEVRPHSCALAQRPAWRILDALQACSGRSSGAPGQSASPTPGCGLQYALLGDHLQVQALLIEHGGKVWRKGAGLVDYRFTERRSW